MIRFAVYFIVLLLGTKSHESDRAQTYQDGFGYELLQARLELLECRVKELFDQQKQQLDTVLKRLDHIEQKIENDSSKSKISQVKKEGSSDVSCMDDTTALEYIEHSTFGGGWLIILQRIDGSESFDRNWSEYRNGFGKIGSELWLGLERMHQLTRKDSYELLIELEDFAGNYGFARYDRFEIGSAADFYSLKQLGTYSGTAGDSLSQHRGAKFSKALKGFQSCNNNYSGLWWFHSGCYHSYLTGEWSPVNEYTSIIWVKFRLQNDNALKMARIMIRKL